MATKQTHDLGRLYTHGMRYPATGRWPLAELGTSHEVEQPWRIGQCLVLRLPLSRAAVVIGWWGRGRTYEELREAEDAAERDTAEPLTLETMRAWQAPPPPETTENPFSVRAYREARQRAAQ